MFSAEITHALSISKPKYIFLSGEVYKAHYDVIENTKIVKTYVIYDDVPMKRNCIPFRDLAEKHVDIKSSKYFDFKGKFTKYKYVFINLNLE